MIYVTVMQIKHMQGKINIFNIYNDCLHSETLMLLDQYIMREAGNLLQGEDDSVM